MTEKFSKREFVDKYPYIVYTGENDISSDDLKVKSGSITSDDLANGAVTTGKIADGAVTTGKIADGAVTSGKLAENAIPTASADTLGGVKVGSGLNITEAGVLSADNVVFIDNVKEGRTVTLNVNFNQIKNYILNKKLPVVYISSDDNNATLAACDGYGVSTGDDDVITDYQVYFGEDTFSASTSTEQLVSGAN